MPKIIVIIAIVFFTKMLAWADEPRWQSSFVSSNGKYEARLQNRVWQLVDKSTGNNLYSFDDYYDRALWLRSMTLVVGNDGRNVVAINDYGEQDYRQNPDVLFFFRGGNLIKRYKLSEVFNPRFLQVSVSHFRWIYPPVKLSINDADSTIELITFEMTHLTFQAENGLLIGKKEDELFSNGAIFVYGSVSSLGNHRYQTKVESRFEGVPKTERPSSLNLRRLAGKVMGFTSR